MISDERLREAAQKVEESMLASLPDPEECKVPPPPEIERKIEKRTRRASHPIRHRVMKAVACFLLVVLVGGGSVLTLSADARAAVVGWVREVYESYFSYRYTGKERPAPQDTVYCPTWLPSGYEIVSEIDTKFPIYIFYENESKDLITFSCFMNAESMEMQIDRDRVEVQNVFVGNILANLYIDQDQGEANVLVWTDYEKGVIFSITAALDGKDLVKIAESIQPKEF